MSGGGRGGCRNAGIMIVLGFVALVTLVSYVLAHDSWISSGGFKNSAGEWCCGDPDCDLLDSKDVSVHADGYHVTFHLLDGQAAGGEVVPLAEAQPSPDGAYWRCHRPDHTRRCFFAPPPNT